MPIGTWVIDLRMPLSICQWADRIICPWMTNWTGDSNGKNYEWMGKQQYFNFFFTSLSFCLPVHHLGLIFIQQSSWALKVQMLF